MKYVVVMGAGSGVAQSLIGQLASMNFGIVAAARELSSLEGLSIETDLMPKQVDPLSHESVKALFDGLAGDGVEVAGYAHCVGSILVAPLHRTSAEQFDDTLKINLYSAMYGLKHYISLAKQQGHGGSAVLVSTCATGIGVPNHEAIAAAKAGIEGLAKSAAATYAPDGIRVNVVAPGLTDTRMASSFLKSDAMRQASAKQYPLSGVNQPEEVASAMSFLLSDHSSRVTGTVLHVDGGFRNIRPLVK